MIKYAFGYLFWVIVGVYHQLFAAKLVYLIRLAGFARKAYESYTR